MATQAAQTEVDVANLALAALGQSPIGTLADNVHRARVMSQLLGTARDAALRQYDWNFATAWIQPALSPVAGLGPYPNRFPMPGDCLKVRFIRDPQTADEWYDDDGRWDIEAATVNPADVPTANMVLVCIASQTTIPPATTPTIIPPLVCYTRRVVLPQLWSADFVVAFAEMLAGMASARILRDPAAAKDMKAAGDAALSAVAQRTAREASPKHISRNTSWVQSRQIGVPWGYDGSGGWGT
jgi:hypothetical protein